MALNLFGMRPEAEGDSFTDRLTSPLFLAGLGMLTGSARGQGFAGMLAATRAANTMQRTRDRNRALDLKQQALDRELESRRIIAQALGGTPPGPPVPGPAPAQGPGVPLVPPAGEATTYPLAGVQPPAQGPTMSDLTQEKLRSVAPSLLALGPEGQKAFSGLVSLYEATKPEDQYTDPYKITRGDGSEILVRRNLATNKVEQIGSGVDVDVNMGDGPKWNVGDIVTGGEEGTNPLLPQGRWQLKNTGWSLLKGDSPSESQAKAAGFYQRMKKSDEEYDTLLESVGGNEAAITPGYVTTLLREVSPVLANMVEQKELLPVDAVRRAWVEAFLRRDSGAVIKDSEYSNIGLTYWPQPQDDKATRTLKRSLRSAAMEGVRRGVHWSDILEMHGGDAAAAAGTESDENTISLEEALRGK